MLQIYCYGPRESGFLDLPEGFTLDMETLAESFDEDLTIGEISLPGSLPWTPNNLRITNFANMVANGAQNLSFKVDIYDAGFPEIQGGKLTIQEKSGSQSLRRGQFTVNISGSRGLFGNAIKGRKLSALTLGGPITFTEGSSREFAQAHSTGAYPALNYLAFAPIAITDFFDQERADYDNEFLALDTVNNIITTGPSVDDWVFGRPLSSDPDTPAPTGNSEYLDYRTIPFFSIPYILRQCFTQFGYNVTGSFFTSPDWAKLYLFNNFAIERYETATATDTNRTINPANHVPDVLIKDFIKAACTSFNMYPVFGAAGNVEFKFRRDRFKNVEVLDITPYVADTFSSTLPENEDPPTGVAYDFGSDSIATDRTPDIGKMNVVANVATPAALATLSIGRPFTINDLVLVASQNLYYRPADATASPVLWEPYADALYPARLPGSTNDNLVTLPMATLASHIKLNTVTAAYEAQGYLAIQAKGSYINNNLRQVTNPCPLRMFYIGRASTDPLSQPITHYHNRFPDGTKRSPCSLALSGADSLGQQYHLPWLQAKQTEIVKLQVQVTAALLKQIRQATQLQIKNTRYLLYRIERKLPMPRGKAFVTLELAVI